MIISLESNWSISYYWFSKKYQDNSLKVINSGYKRCVSPGFNFWLLIERRYDHNLIKSIFFNSEQERQNSVSQEAQNTPGIITISMINYYE